MPDFKKPVADAKVKIAKAETTAFMARLEAIDAILEGADPDDVMLLCALVLARASPLCCAEHQNEFEADFLRMFTDCVVMKQQEQAEQDEAAAEADDNDAPPQAQ
jgi:hypothetical protein